MLLQLSPCNFFCMTSKVFLIMMSTYSIFNMCKNRHSRLDSTARRVHVQWGGEGEGFKGHYVR